MRGLVQRSLNGNASQCGIGSASHYVAVSPDQSKEPVKEFGCFTEDIEAMADIVGKMGQDIIRAIVAGERDPHKLAGLRNYRVRASAETIAKSLEGNWRDEHVFFLSQALSLFDAYQELIVAVDAKLEEMIKPMRSAGSEQEQGQRQECSGL